MGVIICTCEHCTSPDLPIIPQSLEGVDGELCLHTDLCENPYSLKDFTEKNGLQALLIAACSDPKHTRSFKSAARQGGLNPLAIECLPFSEFYRKAKKEAPAELGGLALTVNLAKVRGLRLIGRAVQKRVSSEAEVSRREFLNSLRDLFLDYSEVPVLHQEVCSPYSKTCRYCIDACRYEAITMDGRNIAIDEQTCVECGACASACPVGALQTPTLSDLQIGEIIKAASIEGFGLQKRALLATCDQGVARLATQEAQGRFFNPGFVVFRVPCVASLSWSHLILSAAFGVSLVALCPNPTCIRVEGLTYTSHAFALADELMKSLCEDHTLLKIIHRIPPRELPQTSIQTYEEVPLFTPAGALNVWAERRGMLASALSHLVPQESPAYRKVFHGDASQFFDVSVDPDRCTLCPACAFACPEDAIELKESEGRSILSFSPSRCVGCAACVGSCPETAITVGRVFEPWQICEGVWIEKVEDEIVKCKRCGRPLAPKKTLERVIVTLQAPGFEKVLEHVLLCQYCKWSQGG